MTDDPYIIVGAKTARLLRGPGRKRWLYAIPIGGILVLAGILAAILWPRDLGPVATVKRGDIIHSLVGQGRVEADSTVEILPRVTAPIAQIHVKEGDAVEVGQLLVTLEDAPLAAGRVEAMRALEAAKAKRDEVMRGARSEDLDRSAAQVREAEEECRRAEARLAEIVRGPRPEDIEEVEGQFAAAKAEADRWAKDWERIRKLPQEFSDSEKDEAKRRHELAQAQLRQAKARRDRIVNGATEEEKAQARAHASAAKARLDQAKAAHARLAKGATDEERRLAEAELQRAEATLARLDSEIEQLKLLSPIRGHVLFRYHEPKEMASPMMARPILVLGETTARVIRMEVQEGDVYKLREGMPVRFTSDSYPGQTWTGKVTKMAPVLGQKRLLSDSPKEKSDVKVLEVRITPDAALEVPINLPVEVRIRETIRQNVLVLPAHAVREGQVQLPKGELRAVQIGARDDGFVEILGGLAEGDRVRMPE